MSAARRGKTRLLMTADAVGGVWTYALDLASGLAGHGYETTLAVLGPAPSTGQREAAQRVAGLRLVHVEAPLDWTAGDRDEVLASGRAVARLAGDVGAELIHLNSPALAAGGGFQAPVVGACHSCLATWWDAVKGGEAPDDFRWRTALLAEGYAACDLLIAPTRAFAAATETRYRVQPLAVWNGRATPRFESAERRAVAVTAGRLWDEGKGAAVLDAAAALSATTIEAIGPTEGPAGAYVRLSHARALGALTPAALRERLARSRLYVSPALYEPFGLSVLEAAQAGCGLVLADIPTFRELWDGAAVFTPPGDAEALAFVLDSLSAAPAACERLGRAAKAKAAAYSLEAMARGTAAAYQSLLPMRRTASRVSEATA